MGATRLLVLLAGISKPVKLGKQCRAQRVGVDLFGWLHQEAVTHFDSLVARAPPNYSPVVQAIVDRARVYLAHGIHPLFVLDGRRLPGKGGTDEQRAEKRLLASQAIDAALENLTEDERDEPLLLLAEALAAHELDQRALAEGVLRAAQQSPWQPQPARLDRLPLAQPTPVLAASAGHEPRPRAGAQHGLQLSRRRAWQAARCGWLARCGRRRPARRRRRRGLHTRGWWQRLQLPAAATGSTAHPARRRDEEGLRRAYSGPQLALLLLLRRRLQLRINV
jgi:hypothetical protein